jgi:hypothetical protein
MGGNGSGGKCYFYSENPSFQAAFEAEWDSCTARCIASDMPTQARSSEGPLVLNIMFGRQLEVQLRHLIGRPVYTLAMASAIKTFAIC